MKKIVLFMLVATFLGTSLYGGAICRKIVESMDKASLSSDYKQIAWYAYRHKKKLDYIQRSYDILQKVNSDTANSMFQNSGGLYNIVSIPTADMAAAEANLIAEINTVNIALLKLLIYDSIKKEIRQTFNTN